MFLCPLCIGIKKGQALINFFLLLFFFSYFKGFKYSLRVNWLQNFARKSLITKICFPDLGSFSLTGREKVALSHSSLSLHNLSVKRRLPTKHQPKHLGLPRWLSGKEYTCQCMRRRIWQVRSLGREDPLKQEMATHSNILAWKIP